MLAFFCVHFYRECLISDPMHGFITAGSGRGNTVQDESRRFTWLHRPSWVGLASCSVAQLKHMWPSCDNCISAGSFLSRPRLVHTGYKIYIKFSYFIQKRQHSPSVNSMCDTNKVPYYSAILTNILKMGHWYNEGYTSETHIKLNCREF